MIHIVFLIQPCKRKAYPEQGRKWLPNTGWAEKVTFWQKKFVAVVAIFLDFWISYPKMKFFWKIR